jgi:lysophospholipase L1-like esterase
MTMHMEKPMTQHQGPFRRVVILGESNAYGMCASRHAYEWGQVLARLLRQFQDSGPELINRALPSEVISPRSPGWEMSAKPSLLERYRRHGIDADPDLVIISQGLNDMRSAMPVQDYLADLEQIVADISSETGALVVLVGIYPQIYGRGANDPAGMAEFARGNATIADVYNYTVRLVAEKHGALFVDTLGIFGDGEWFIHPDCCHLNDLGHIVLGNAIFQVIATHCRGLGDRTLRLIDEQGTSTANTGGTDTDADIQTLWKAAEARFAIEF